MKNIMLLSDERLNEIEFKFESTNEIKEIKNSIEELEGKLISKAGDNEELKDLYQGIDELNVCFRAREIELFYEIGFRDAIEFLINKKV
jgi:wobble nucleotide-excising tRNase